MNKLVPPPNVLQIFVRNKLRDGLTRSEIAALIRQRLRWHELEPATMDNYAAERYRLAHELLQSLEENSN